MEMNVNMADAVRRMTMTVHVRVRGVRRALVRFRLMCLLFRLAAWVGGIGAVRVERDGAPNE